MEHNNLDLHEISLSSLNPELRNTLSCLLNSKKILSSDGPEKLPRDWRGLASLVNISTEVVGNINEYPDKTAQIIDIWVKRNDGTATLGTLMEYLQKLDRFDVYDDLLDLIKTTKLPVSNSKAVALPVNGLSRISTADVLTFDDRRAGCPQHYHAYVLYAAEDAEFVKELLMRMQSQGFKLCTIHDLMPGHQTQYGPVAQLISQRCSRIILVYSPAFLDSPDNKFYTDYAQAVGIESKERNIIPIIYKECTLPMNLTYYHRLYYKPNEWSPFNFWDKLAESLGQVKNMKKMKVPLSPGPQCTSSHSALSIQELSSNFSNGYSPDSSQSKIISQSASFSDLLDRSSTTSTAYVAEDAKSISTLSEISHSSTEKKKNGVLGKMQQVFRIKRKEKKLHG